MWLNCTATSCDGFYVTLVDVCCFHARLQVPSLPPAHPRLEAEELIDDDEDVEYTQRHCGATIVSETKFNIPVGSALATHSSTMS